MWKGKIPQSHTADQPTALCGRAKYHNHTLQTQPTALYGTAKIPQSHTADQPKAMCGRAIYHNHTLQTQPMALMVEPNTTITHCRPTHGTVWKSQIQQSHTADQPTALCGRAKYHNHTLQTQPTALMVEPNTTITHCRPTHGTVLKSQIPQYHTADQPTALYGRAKNHNHTLQTNPWHCVEEPNTTISQCRPTHGTVWKGQIPQSHTADQPTALCGRAKYHNHTLQTQPTALYGRAKIPQSHTADQPKAMRGRVKYHNYTLQTNPWHCMVEPNTTITH